MPAETVADSVTKEVNGLTPQQLRQFDTDGYLTVRNCLSPHDLQPIIGEIVERVEVGTREAVCRGMLTPTHTFDGAPLETRAASVSAACSDRHWLWRTFFSDHHRRTEGVFALATSPALLNAVESLIGAEILTHPLFNLRCKMPNHEATVVRWHQDLDGLEREAASNTLIITAWIPLVAATAENGCLQVIQGSHRVGLLPHGFPESYGNKSLKAIADCDTPPGRVVNIELNVGDILLMTERTVHRSLPNQSRSIRWSFDVRYSKVGVPNGRALVPGFVARSRENPESVCNSLGNWNRLFDEPTDSTALHYHQWRPHQIDEDGWAAKDCSVECSGRLGFDVLEMSIEYPGWAGQDQQTITFSIDGEDQKVVIGPGEHRLRFHSQSNRPLSIRCTSSSDFSLPNGDGRRRSFRIVKVEHTRRSV